MRKQRTKKFPLYFPTKQMIFFSFHPTELDWRLKIAVVDFSLFLFIRIIYTHLSRGKSEKELSFREREREAENINLETLKSVKNNQKVKRK